MDKGTASVGKGKGIFSLTATLVQSCHKKKLVTSYVCYVRPVNRHHTLSLDDIFFQKTKGAGSN